MTKFEQDLKDCIDILDILTRASSHLEDNLPVINSNSRENIIDAHPKGYFSISIVEDVFCSCLLMMRTLSILRTYVNEWRNYLTLKELSSEKSFWWRKLLEHLLRSILLSESTDTEFRLYLRYDILEYCVRNSEEQKHIFWENSEHLSGINIQIEKIIEHKEKNGC